MDVTSFEPSALPFTKVGELKPQAVGTRWLIESLWLDNAAGIIGGQPKCCKSWLGLDMAVSVASNTPCLGRFPVTTKGSSLVYLAEDAVEEVRKRVENICMSRQLLISELDLVVITAPVLRLDDEHDRLRLWTTIEKLRPKLLLLDPLVRLHRLDENNARDIALLLGYLREIQRKAQCAVVLTHHAGKRACSRPGQGLRGSGDLHAFGDSNLYLSRNNTDSIELVAEHRSAPAPDTVLLNLLGSENDTHLAVIQKTLAPTMPSLEGRIIEHLANSDAPVPRTLLRTALRANNQRFGLALADLLASGQIIASPSGITLT